MKVSIVVICKGDNLRWKKSQKKLKTTVLDSAEVKTARSIFTKFGTYISNMPI